MKKLFATLSIILLLVACNGRENCDNCYLLMQLPNNMLYNKIEFKLPDTLIINEYNFISTDTVYQKIRLTNKEVAEINKASIDLLNSETEEHYGFTDNGERTDLMFEIYIKSANKDKFILLYGTNSEKPKVVNNYIKILTNLSSKYKE